MVDHLLSWLLLASNILQHVMMIVMIPQTPMSIEPSVVGRARLASILVHFQMDCTKAISNKITGACLFSACAHAILRDRQHFCFIAWKKQQVLRPSAAC